MKNIAIFASGTGTNAQNIIKYFEKSIDISVKIIVSNNPNAYVLNKAKELDVKTKVFSRNEFYSPGVVCRELMCNSIDYIVLAGFLWLVPADIVKTFEKRIINIHPALLPKYGGKGMYGENVHKAVIDNKELFSGITIHFVNEKYDNGDIIFQAKCAVFNNDSPDSLAKKVHELEYKYFPKVIESVILR